MDEDSALALQIAQRLLGRDLLDAERQMLLKFLRDNPDVEVREALNRLSSAHDRTYSRPGRSGNRELLEKLRGVKKLD